MLTLLLGAALAAAGPAPGAPPRADDEGGAQLLFLEPAAIARVCGIAPQGKVRLGCAGIAEDGRQYLALPDPCLLPSDADLYASILCEALKRANGRTSK